MTGGTRGAVRQSALAQGNAVCTLQEVRHKALPLFPVYPAEVTPATGFWLIQWMGLGTECLTFYNIVRPVTGNTADGLRLSSDPGISVNTVVELLLGLVMASCTIDFGQSRSMWKVRDRLQIRVAVDTTDA